MNLFTKRHSGPPPLLEDRSIFRQQAQQKRDAVWSKKMMSAFDKQLDQRAVIYKEVAEMQRIALKEKNHD